MTESQKSRRLLDRLRIPPADWAAVFAAIPSEDRSEYARDLEALAEAAARMAGYFASRQPGGDHAAGVKNSNRVGTVVRRALGFTYPRQDINF